MDYKEKYKERLLNHIKAVNHYAAKLGLEYPYHDKSKLDMLFEPYSLWMKPNKTEEETKMLDQATLIHIRNAPHHPEYWTDTSLEGFTRQNYTPKGPIDATDMPDECIVEMVCDWQAVAHEKGNTAEEWFKKVNGSRWIFSEHQQYLIKELIKETND